MKVQIWPLLATVLVTSSATASPTPAEFPCHGLPPGAVEAVPAPFNAYMEIVCTRVGQSLIPKKGLAFIGPDHLPHGFLAYASEDPVSANVYFTALNIRDLDENSTTKLRAELRKLTNVPALLQARIIWMDEATSTGRKKQLVLLIPPSGADIAVQGMECNTDCLPITEDPWFFSVEGHGTE
jgi:hypothetical protein